MVAVAALNEKQRARARRTVELATGAAQGDVDAALDAAGGDAKIAIVSLLAGVDAAEARVRLDRNDGVVRRSLEAS
jgi:N-acetylmuramic acid 6-phosphate etherase